MSVIVAFQGETGAFSEAAAEALVPERPVLFPCATFDAVVRAVTEGGADYGVLPVENRIAGPVHESLAALERTAMLERLREHELPVRLALLGLAGAREGDVREVLSHPIALAQVGRWLAAHPQVRAHEAHDTAGAARMVAIRRDPSVAAIAAPWAAAHYGLQVLAENIQDRADNVTRFVLVRRRPGAQRDLP